MIAFIINVKYNTFAITMQLGVLCSVHMQVYSFKVYYDFHT